jgi:uncharacterized protein with von Willebrand factor type A (vWA) domain
VNEEMTLENEALQQSVSSIKATNSDLITASNEALQTREFLRKKLIEIDELKSDCRTLEADLAETKYNSKINAEKLEIMVILNLSDLRREL